MSSDNISQHSADCLQQMTWMLQSMHQHSQNVVHSQIEIATQLIRAGHPKYSDPLRLYPYEFKSYSQFGEDGAIQEVFRRIGTTNKQFVEFGVERGLENNTAYLLLSGWSGVWIEPVADYVAEITRGYTNLMGRGRLTVIHDHVTVNNVETLFQRAAVPTEPDLLSIDIDSNDYWVWQRITNYHPRVVILEYNATFPPPTEWIMPHSPTYRWNGTVNFGASLQSMTVLSQQKGYSLVGCTLGGSNAIFVRDDLVGDRFAAPFTASNHYEPPRYYLAAAHQGHKRSYEPFVDVAPPRAA